MIYCCGEYHIAEEKISLQDNEKFEERYIEVITCPKCLKKKALYSARRILDGKLIEKISKKGKVDSFIKKWKKEPWEDALKPPKMGTFNNMFWLYINGKNDSIVRDFNEEVRFEFNSECKKIYWYVCNYSRMSAGKN